MTLVISTGRRRSTRMSTSGWSTLVSIQAQNAASPSPPSVNASTRGEPQPHALALLSPYSRLASATDSSAAPSQSTFASGRVSWLGT